MAIDDGPDAQVIPDLVFRRWRTVVEHEGAQHQEDRRQYNLDLGRYAWMRRHDVGYVQSTHEKLRHPRSLVGEVFAELVSRGYDGPPPVFGERWATLFARVSQVLGPRDYRQAAVSVAPFSRPQTVPGSPLPRDPADPAAQRVTSGSRATATKSSDR